MPDHEDFNHARRQFEELVEGLTLAGDHEPRMDAYEYEEALKQLPEEHRQLAEEMKRFFSLTRCYFERKQKIDPEIMRATEELSELPLDERLVRVREVNRKLLEGIERAGDHTTFRV